MERLTPEEIARLPGFGGACLVKDAAMLRDSMGDIRHSVIDAALRRNEIDRSKP